MEALKKVKSYLWKSKCPDCGEKTPPDELSVYSTEDGMRAVCDSCYDRFIAGERVKRREEPFPIQGTPASKGFIDIGSISSVAYIGNITYSNTYVESETEPDRELVKKITKDLSDKVDREMLELLDPSPPPSKRRIEL